jgi:hypothetical protein
MTDIEQVLKDRGEKYGKIEDNSRITWQLWEVLETAPNFKELNYVQKTCIWMNLHKTARMICGDPLEPDNPLDMEGYSRLMKEYILKLQGQQND